ncbi:MAG: energy-coupling factor transport system substrate-specific component [Clostridiales bacterium]|jgi:energy-coupling factor transport system substrate-specific component|nr:energy-coupling factor transport system substrate-specific component [Clostridiales bacterium]
MNYGLISAAVLLIALILIFITYEKQNTSIKEISLVATLSGLAGVSRVPFAAIPNVQPTTFLVIISGYIFGPKYGFTVGIVATIVSNSFLGHGPWTPWQMLAWGMAGFSAGVLKHILKTPSKWILSIFAFAWGFLFDYIMNLWHWLFFIYPLNLKSFIAVYAASFYFDLMHAVSNFIFVYLFGADFAKILQRFKDRLSFTEMPYEKIDEWRDKCEKDYCFNPYCFNKSNKFYFCSKSKCNSKSFE